ncbi:uncharacterized protein SPPG_04743 [Spizellomyces punctatus DAOM BR117]|uniref:Transmembrane protein n=1 Tax=Spizellomyces punctatus (strain DAOM BR117) TaxID=645134 RepID=A0A0L0HG04_SPIPD|nr:uncharacterized protein SPPG_04743 [Spizellomyces punctatus DAOM BR117]KND00421.1 hypothetical protein SPPG_04743 [Spizellomyces punctatus DAOM BR117]|eukprot:XP_016608460.1 hypothetical protein SPPG_04743 [Spizellomyces punctatus DAOM BR117]
MRGILFQRNVEKSRGFTGVTAEITMSEVEVDFIPDTTATLAENEAKGVGDVDVGTIIDTVPSNNPTHSENPFVSINGLSLAVLLIAIFAAVGLAMVVRVWWVRRKRRRKEAGETVPVQANEAHAPMERTRRTSPSCAQAGLSGGAPIAESTGLSEPVQPASVSVDSEGQQEARSSASSFWSQLRADVLLPGLPDPEDSFVQVVIDTPVCGAEVIHSTGIIWDTTPPTGTTDSSSIGKRTLGAYDDAFERWALDSTGMRSGSRSTTSTSHSRLGTEGSEARIEAPGRKHIRMDERSVNLSGNVDATPPSRKLMRRSFSYTGNSMGPSAMGFVGHERISEEHPYVQPQTPMEEVAGNNYEASNVMQSLEQATHVTRWPAGD